MHHNGQGSKWQKVRLEREDQWLDIIRKALEDMIKNLFYKDWLWVLIVFPSVYSGVAMSRETR